MVVIRGEFVSVERIRLARMRAEYRRRQGRYRDITDAVFSSDYRGKSSVSPVTYKKGKRMPTPISSTDVLSENKDKRGRKGMFSPGTEWNLAVVGAVLDVTEDVKGKKKKSVPLASIVCPLGERTEEGIAEFGRLSSAVRTVVKSSTGNPLARFGIKVEKTKLTGNQWRMLVERKEDADSEEEAEKEDPTPASETTEETKEEKTEETK